MNRTMQALAHGDSESSDRRERQYGDQRFGLRLEISGNANCNTNGHQIEQATSFALMQPLYRHRIAEVLPCV